MVSETIDRGEQINPEFIAAEAMAEANSAAEQIACFILGVPYHGTPDPELVAFIKRMSHEDIIANCGKRAGLLQAVTELLDS